MEHCGMECAAVSAPVRCEVRREVCGRKNGPRRAVETVKVLDLHSLAVTARPVCGWFMLLRT